MIKKKTQTIPENINLPSYFVGIGASAGGLEALEEFLKKCQLIQTWPLLLFNIFLLIIKV
jgi:chemotaxis response regulator CheB